MHFLGSGLAMAVFEAFHCHLEVTTTAEKEIEISRLRAVGKSPATDSSSHAVPSHAEHRVWRGCCVICGAGSAASSGA